MNQMTETQSPPAAQRPAATGVAGFPRDLLQAITAAESSSAASQEVLRLVAESGVARAVLLLQRREGAPLSVAAERIVDPAIKLDTKLRTTVLAAGQSACRSGEEVLVERSGPMIAVPVFVRGGAPESLVLIVDPDQVTRARQLAAIAATHLTLAQLLGDFGELTETVCASAATLELLERVDTTESVEAAAGEVVNQLQDYLECSRVAMAMRRGAHQCRLIALSGAKEFDRHSEFVRAIEAAVDEAILRHEPTRFPAGDGSDRHALRAHQRLAALAEANCVVSFPLLGQHGETAGVWVFLGEKTLLDPHQTRFLETLGPLVAQLFELLRNTRPNGLLAHGAKVVSARNPRALAAIAIVVLATLCLPVKYRVSCSCELQPTTRRYIAAPYDGKLADAMVSPGDVVAADQLLATLDGHEIQWELDGVRVDHDKARKAHDTALAKHKVADAQLARLEMDRLELQRRLLESRLEQLEIKTPVAGIVLSGDLERTEGAPVTVGQTLFEIAPLDRMVVELAIPENEVAHVRENDPVRLTLDAYPSRRWTGSVHRIHPRAEVIDSKSVFVAEVPLENAHGLLRPGMKGKARTVGRRHLLIWNWLHRPYEAVLKAVLSGV